MKFLIKKWYLQWKLRRITNFYNRRIKHAKKHFSEEVQKFIRQTRNLETAAMEERLYDVREYRMLRSAKRWKVNLPDFGDDDALDAFRYVKDEGTPVLKLEEWALKNYEEKVREARHKFLVAWGPWVGAAAAVLSAVVSAILLT